MSVSLVTMNFKLVLAAAMGLAAGCGLFLFLPRTATKSLPAAGSPIVESAPAAAPVAESAGARIEPAQAQAIAPATIAPAAHAPVSAWSKLAEKYGPERTVLSSKITSNLTSVIKDGMELANAAAVGSGAGSLAEAATRDLVRNAANRLTLTETQQQQVATVIQAAVSKRIQAVGDLTEAMGTEPEKIMEVMLAGDALARNEMTQAEYDQLTLPTRTMLKQVAGFVTGRPGADPGAQLLLDPATTAELNAFLTPEQQTKLAEMASALAEKIQARQANAGNRAMNFQPGELPVMEIQRLDQAVTSFKQMAEAGRLMLEAMKNLREATPRPAVTPGQ